MLVTDASVIATALIDDDADGAAARERFIGEELIAPEIVDLEVLSVIRQLETSGRLPARRAEFAVRDLVLMPVHRVGHRRFLARCWELRHNVTMYDAAYVAVAEQLGVPLITSDVRLSRAAGLRCEVEVLTSTG